MSAQEVVCHIADCEQFYADRIKRTIAMERPLIVGADGWLYPKALHYTERDIELDLALVEATHNQMAADLDRLAPETWERAAMPAGCRAPLPCPRRRAYGSYPTRRA